MFKYETHLHTSGCSACGVSTAEEMVIAAKAHNYAGVIFTNHFYHGNTSVNRKLDWRDFVEKYERDYLRAVEAGKLLDIDPSNTSTTSKPVTTSPSETNPKTGNSVAILPILLMVIGASLVLTMWRKNLKITTR